MSVRPILQPGAVRDLAEAHDWYERQQTGLGRKFLDAVEASLRRIANRPNGFPTIHQDVRRALVARFPYSVYFRLRMNEVRVLAVVHQHRNPEVWKRRVLPE